MTSALVLLSGGQDSTTCLFWALAPAPLGGGFGRVEALGFDYGQRHGVELEQARRIAEMAGVPFHVADLTGLLAGSALLADEAGDTNAEHALAPGLPASFVPGRNALFLTAAASYGFVRGITDLVGGMCQTDAAGYPDCRGELRPVTGPVTLSLALDAEVTVHTPLMDADQGRDLEAGGRPGHRGRRRRAGGRPRAQPHRLPRRPDRAPRVGLRPARQPGLAAARPGLGRGRGAGVGAGYASLTWHRRGVLQYAPTAGPGTYEPSPRSASRARWRPNWAITNRCAAACVSR